MVHLGERGSSDVTDRQWRVESCDFLSVFGTLVGYVFAWLDFLLFLMLAIMKKFWKLDRANISQILAVKPNSRNEQDNTSGCS